MEYSEETKVQIQCDEESQDKNDETLTCLQPSPAPNPEPSIPVTKVLRSSNNNSPLTGIKRQSQSQRSSQEKSLPQPEESERFESFERSLAPSKRLKRTSRLQQHQDRHTQTDNNWQSRSQTRRVPLQNTKSKSPSRKRSNSREHRHSKETRQRVTRSYADDTSEKTDREVQQVSTPSALTFFMTYFVTGINQGCMFIYLGMMPFLFKQYGMDPVTFGYAMSGAAFLTLCSSPLLGRVADVMGSRTVLILCMISTTAAHITMGLAANVYMLVISRALGLLMDCMPAAQMIVTDIAPESERGRYLGKIMIPMSAGMIVGPTLGGVLSKYFGSQGTLLLTCMAPLVCILIILTFIPHQKKQVKVTQAKKGGINWERLGELMGKGDIPRLFVLRVLSTLPGMLFMMNFQLAGVNFFKLTPQGNGMIVSCLGIMNMINNWFTLGFLAKFFTPDQLLKIAPVLSVATYFLLSQVTEVWQLVCMLFFINLCYSIMENQVMTRLTRSVDSKDTSTMVGLGTALFQASRTVSPTLGGVLMQQYGFPAIGATGTAVSVLMALLALSK